MRILCLSLIAALGAVSMAWAANPPGLLLVVGMHDELGPKGNGYLGIYDTESGKQLAKVDEGAIHAHELTVSPDGKYAYAPIYSDSPIGTPGNDGHEMVVIDVAARKVVERIDFGRRVRPHSALWNKRDNLIYVTTEMDKTVSIVDPKTNKIVGAIPTGGEGSHGLVLSHDGRRAYTSNVLSGDVSVLDLKTRKLVKVIPVASKIGKPISSVWRVQRIAISRDDKTVFTSDWIGEATLVAIDAKTNTVKKRIPLPGGGLGASATPDGRWLMVAIWTTNKLAIVDMKTLEVARVIDVPDVPEQMIFTQDNKQAYLVCSGARKIVTVNLGDWSIEDKFIPTGNHPDGIAWVPRPRD